MCRIILEFIGGSWDARNLSNQSLDPFEVRLAVHKYRITDQGQIGKAVVLHSQFAVDYFTERDGENVPEMPQDGEVYAVTDRTEYQDEVLVRFEHRP